MFVRRNRPKRNQSISLPLYLNSRQCIKTIIVNVSASIMSVRFGGVLFCFFVEVLEGGYLSFIQSINQAISLDRSIIKSINHSISQSINHSINQSIDQLINQSIILSINQSINQSIIRSINQSINRSITQPFSQRI